MGLKQTTACLGYQQIEVLTSSVGLTLPTTGGVQPVYAIIQAEAQAVRWRDDGAAPTASIGMTIPAGSELRYDGDLTKIRFIEVTATAKLNVSYYA